MKLTKLITALLFLVSTFSGNTYAQRNIETLEKGWKFFKGEASGAALKARLQEQRNLTIMTANGKM